MTIRKKVTTSLIALILVSLIGIAVYAAISYYGKIGKTGLKNSVPYGFGKEATVIFLAGQSNAAGCSHDEYLKKNLSSEQYAKYEEGFDNVYINYFVSGTNESGGFTTCRARQGEFGTCFGPELGLAEALNELYPDKTFFIIKYAWGGTSLDEYWHAPSGTDVGGALYNSFLEYASVSLDYLTLRGYDVKIEAMCWMQGESDSTEEAIAAKYAQNLSNMIDGIRTEFSNRADKNGIAFIDAYIAAHWDHSVIINEAKQIVANTSPLNEVIDTIGQGLTVTNEPTDEPDLAHYDSMSEIKLGHLFAQACAKFLD